MSSTAQKLKNDFVVRLCFLLECNSIHKDAYIEIMKLIMGNTKRYSHPFLPTFIPSYLLPVIFNLLPLIFSSLPPTAAHDNPTPTHFKPTPAHI